MLPHKQCGKLSNSFCRFHLTQKTKTLNFYFFISIWNHTLIKWIPYSSLQQGKTQERSLWRVSCSRHLLIYSLWMRHQILWCQCEEIKSFSFAIIMDLPVQFNYCSLSVWCFQIYVFLSCFIGLYSKIWKAARCATHTQLGDCYCWATFLGYIC